MPSLRPTSKLGRVAAKMLSQLHWTPTIADLQTYMAHRQSPVAIHCKALVPGTCARTVAWAVAAMMHWKTRQLCQSPSAGLLGAIGVGLTVTEVGTRKREERTLHG